MLTGMSEEINIASYNHLKILSLTYLLKIIIYLHENVVIDLRWGASKPRFEQRTLYLRDERSTTMPQTPHYFTLF